MEVAGEQSGYAWQADGENFFAHACQANWYGISWVGVCGVRLEHPDDEHAVGKTKCGMCIGYLEAVRDIADEKPGLVTGTGVRRWKV